MTKPEQEMFDLEAVYDAEIAPLMTQILAICQRERLPMFASFAYAQHDDDRGTAFCTSHLQWPERQVPKFHEAERDVRCGPSFMAMTIVSDPNAR